MSEEVVEEGFARIEAALPSLGDGPQYETSELLVFSASRVLNPHHVEDGSTDSERETPQPVDNPRPIRLQRGVPTWRR